MVTIEKGVIKAPENDRPIHEKGLGWHIFECMKRHKEYIAQICTQSGVKETFGDVLKRAIRTALELKKRGVTSSDVISTCTYNNLNSCVPILASLFLNCKIASLDPTISLTDTVYLINEIKPKIIFIDQESEELYSQTQKCIVNFKLTIISFASNSSTKFEPFTNFIKPSVNNKEKEKEEDEFLPTVAEDLRETILIFFSSGTTGLPKATCLHHYGIMKNLGANFEEKLISSSVLIFTTNYWISSFQILYYSVQNAVTRLIVNKFEANKAWKIIEEHKPTFLLCSPHLLSEMLDCKAGKTHVQIHICLIGQKANTSLLESAREKLPNALINNPYGMTEACSHVFHCDFAQEKLKKNTCGTVFPGNSYKIVDVDTGKLCGPNEKGELYIKSKNLMNGYYKRERDSSKAFEDGWLKTGDIFYYDEDLYFYFVDRTKEMFKYKSWHIVPAKLEAVLCEHPDVVNAVVIGIPHHSDGDHPCAIVKLKKDVMIKPEEVKKFADEKLDERQKLRGGLHVIADFPLTPTGKINRRLIKEMFTNNYKSNQSKEKSTNNSLII